MSSCLLHSVYSKCCSPNLAGSESKKLCSFLYRHKYALKQQPLCRKQSSHSTKVSVFDKLRIRSFLMAVSTFSRKYPLTRGMAVYVVIWPTSNLIQQAIIGKPEFNFAETLRFCLYGSVYVAPTLHAWLSFAAYMWPGRTIKAALTRAIVEQFTYTPFAMISFFFIMSLMEGQSLHDALLEVKVKFLPTYQVGALVWPVLQTINHTLVPERNRVPFVGFCSLLWTCFLAYMKQLEAKKLLELKEQRKAEKKLKSEKNDTKKHGTIPLASISESKISPEKDYINLL